MVLTDSTVTTTTYPNITTPTTTTVVTSRFFFPKILYNISAIIDFFFLPEMFYIVFFCRFDIRYCNKYKHYDICKTNKWVLRNNDTEWEKNLFNPTFTILMSTITQDSNNSNYIAKCYFYILSLIRYLIVVKELEYPNDSRILVLGAQWPQQHETYCNFTAKKETELVWKGEL